jgi:serine/threonine protein kinase
MEGSEPASFLPENIRDILRRKSSRDPNSRFTTKLQVLLSYTSQYPALREQVGIHWTTDEEFRINKSVLSSVMGIKLNTMNVNLRDLKFEQSDRNKDGWTSWKRPGFTRQSEPPDLSMQSASIAPSRANFTVARLTPAKTNEFWQSSMRLWSDLFGTDDSARDIPGEQAVDQAARHFKHNEQPLENAKDVIRAIMARQGRGDALTFTEFSRFMAMFGPGWSVMLKIASLLTCSNNTGKWLTFDSQAPETGVAQARFDDAEPNCLVVKHCDGKLERVYNDPLVPHGRDPYVTDQRGEAFMNWDDYFRIHPVRTSDLG